MSVDYQYGNVLYVCDECGEPSDAYENFKELNREAKLEGWFISREDESSEWEHYCPKCAKQLAPKVN